MPNKSVAAMNRQLDLEKRIEKQCDDVAMVSSISERVDRMLNISCPDDGDTSAALKIVLSMRAELESIQADLLTL